MNRGLCTKKESSERWEKVMLWKPGKEKDQDQKISSGFGNDCVQN